MSSAGHKGRSSSPFKEAATTRCELTSARGCPPGRGFVILRSGGSALVRRRIQTPSDATVLSVVQPEGEVVLGASPPARRLRRRAGREKRPSGKAGRPLTVGIASDASAARHLRSRAGSGLAAAGKARRRLTIGIASDAAAARHLRSRAGREKRGPPRFSPRTRLHLVHR